MASCLGDGSENEGSRISGRYWQTPTKQIPAHGALHAPQLATPKPVNWMQPPDPQHPPGKIGGYPGSHTSPPQLQTPPLQVSGEVQLVVHEPQY